jgi:hypothetical protein
MVQCYFADVQLVQLKKTERQNVEFFKNDKMSSVET